MEADKNSNEFERLVELAELDFDYTRRPDNLKDLTTLAARIIGTKVSLVNLLDQYTQWSVANYGIDIQRMPREDSVCQFTILEDSLEIKDLSEDDRFEGKNYVEYGPKLRYYFGVPLITSGGAQIGALCVLDSEPRNISSEEKELLEMLADQVVNRLEMLKKIKDLQAELKEAKEKQYKVCHDIKNPVSGMIDISQIIKEEMKEANREEIVSLVNMLQKGGHSLLYFLEEVMAGQAEEERTAKNELSCKDFGRKLKELYQPQARSKGVELNITTGEEADNILFSKSMLLQIAGNLISNSIKFTGEGGAVDVEISVKETDTEVEELLIKVEDSGIGIEEDKIDKILKGKAASEEGTGGENGYGFGLSLVHHLVEKRDGSMKISSEPGKGSTFIIEIPI